MNIGVIGGGSIGLLTSYYLQKNGHTVTLYVRRYEQLQALQTQGLSILPFERKVNIHVTFTEELQEHDLLVVCTKQLAVTSVIELLKNKNYDRPVLFLQNGMGHISYLRELSIPTAVGVMEHGALRVNDYTAHHTGRGKLRIAAMTIETQDLKTIVSQLISEDFPVQIEINWYTMLAEKLVINAVINPVTAMFQVKNGQVIDNPFLKNIAKRLCEEACLVLQLSSKQHWERVQQIAELTQENLSSMAKDIKTRQKTEIEAISGFLLKEASVDIPYTLQIYEGIKAIEYSFEMEGEE